MAETKAKTEAQKAAEKFNDTYLTGLIANAGYDAKEARKIKKLINEYEAEKK